MNRLRIIRYSLLLSLAILLFSCQNEDKIEENIDPFVSEFIEEINADSLEFNVQWLQDMQTRFMLANNRKQVAQKIQEKFIAIGISNTQIDSFLINRLFNGVTYHTWQYNVIATIDGSVTPNEYCVVGAHYDSYTRDTDYFTFSTGANDNASGVSALFEISRLMQKRSFTPQSTIQFVAFAAEELGLYGSWDFAAKSANALKNIKMMLNFDMIAHCPSNNPADWTVNILDYQNSISLRQEAQRYCSLYTNLKTINDNTDNNRSDSYLFYQYGYPAIFFFSAAADDTYHTSNDIVSNCNFDYCREIVMASTALLIENNK